MTAMKTIKSKDVFELLGNSHRLETLIVNQVVIMFDNGSLFYSYGTLIGAMVKGKFYFTKYHDYSRTTSKWCTRWCGLGTKVRRDFLDHGIAVFIEDQALPW